MPQPGGSHLGSAKVGAEQRGLGAPYLVPGLAPEPCQALPSLFPVTSLPLSVYVPHFRGPQLISSLTPELQLAPRDPLACAMHVDPVPWLLLPEAPSGRCPESCLYGRLGICPVHLGRLAGLGCECRFLDSETLVTLWNAERRG